MNFKLTEWYQTRDLPSSAAANYAKVYLGNSIIDFRHQSVVRTTEYRRELSVIRLFYTLYSAPSVCRRLGIIKKGNSSHKTWGWSVACTLSTRQEIFQRNLNLSFPGSPGSKIQWRYWKYGLPMQDDSSTESSSIEAFSILFILSIVASRNWSRSVISSSLSFDTWLSSLNMVSRYTGDGESSRPEIFLAREIRVDWRR